MRRVTWMAGSLAMAVLSGCAPAAETAEQAEARMASEATAARTAIDAVNAQMMAYFAASQGDSAAALFAENGRMMVPNGPAAVGREAIAKGMTEMAGMKPVLTLTTESLAVNGPIAVERGTYTFSMSPPGAPAPITESGKYLVHWHKVGDKWMMVDDIWNSDQPPMPMGPAPK